MTVELASTSSVRTWSTRFENGSLIGAATVEALPKTAGRVEAVNVRWAIESSVVRRLPSLTTARSSNR